MAITSATTEQLSMTPKQQAVYEGLKSWRPEIAAFYKDGLSLVASNLESKSNLISHLMREIDGGLRDMFKIVPDQPIEQKTDSPKESHKESILRAFGLSEDTELFRKYHNAVKKGPQYAHRSGTSIDGPRDSKEVVETWKTFEDCMLQLIGSYNASLRLQGSILALDVPNEDFLRRKHIILSDDSKKVYFYTHLDKPGWLVPLFESGAFDCANNPAPLPSPDRPGAYSYPYWAELSYVNRVAEKLSAENDAEWETILKIIDQIVESRRGEDAKTPNPQTDNTAYNLVSLLPEDKLRAFDFNKIEELLLSTGTFFAFDFMRKLLPRLLRIPYKEGALFCLRLVFGKKENEANGYPKYLPLFETHDVKYYLGQIKSEIHQVCGVDGFNVLMGLIEETKDDPNYLFLHTLEEHDEQNRHRDDYTDTLLFFTLDYYLSLTPEDAQKVSAGLLNSRDDIFKRMAYWMIDKRYDEVNNALWQYESNPVNDASCYPELYRLFKNNCEKFSDEQIGRCVDWIEGFNTDCDFEGGNKELIVAHHKKMVAVAFQGLGSEKMNLLIEKLTALDPAPIEHPGYSSYTSTIIGTKVNLPQYDITGLSIPEIGEMYARVESENTGDFLHCPIEGLSSDFRDIVKANIAEYTTNCDAMADVPIGMQSVWLWEIIRSLDGDTHINNVDSVLRVLLMTISKEEFWEEYRSENKSFGKNHRYITEILMLFPKIMRGHRSIVTKDTLDSIFPILYKIDTETSYEYDNNWDGSFQVFVNNLMFRVYENLIVACYWETKLTDRTSAEQWNSKIKAKLNDYLSSSEEKPMVFHAMGIQYGCLRYIDPEWCASSYPAIFNSDNTVNDKAAFYGFFLNGPLAYRDVFDFLYSNGSIQCVLSNPQDYDSTIVKHVVLYILDAVRMGVLDDVAVKMILDTENEGIYRNIIDFSYALKEGDSREYEGIIRHLWGMIYDFCCESENVNRKTLIGNSFAFIEHFDSIDSELEKWLLLSVKNSHKNTSFHIANRIERFLETNPESVGRVILELIMSIEYPYLPELPQIVEKVYGAGHKNLGNSICEEAAKKQIYNLKELYEKNNIK